MTRKIIDYGTVEGGGDKTDPGVYSVDYGFGILNTLYSLPPTPTTGEPYILFTPRRGLLLNPCPPRFELRTTGGEGKRRGSLDGGVVARGKGQRRLLQSVTPSVLFFPGTSTEVGRPFLFSQAPDHPGDQRLRLPDSG